MDLRFINIPPPRRVIRIDSSLLSGTMNILGYFDDSLYEPQPIEEIRFTSRIFLRNEHGKIAFLAIEGEDFFGKRHHLETPGGGVEANETFFEAAQRELMEELGASARELSMLGCVIDRYHLIRRMTISVYVEAVLDQLHALTQRTEEETILIADVVWLSETEALKRLRHHENAVDELIHRRELCALEALLKRHEEGR
jgi:8-oxo-dGTP pyrophosphatase MutT (NUDIX family)